MASGVGPKGRRTAQSSLMASRLDLGVPRLVVVVLTGGAFIGLWTAGWLGTLPLAAIIGILFVGGALSEASFQVARARGGFGTLIVVPLVAVSVVIYSIAWGPALAIGFLYPLGEAFKLERPPPLLPVLVTLAAGFGTGEALVATRVLHSYVPTPYDHGLAALGLLGIMVVFQMLTNATTARTKAAAALANREESFRLLFAYNPQPMWVYDEESLDILAVNNAAVAHYGYSQAQWLSMRITDMRPEEDIAVLAADLARPRADYEQSAGWHHKLADGSVIDVEISSHRTEYLGRSALLVSAFDVTERNRLETRLRIQAYHDDLTGLPNRVQLRAQVEAMEADATASGSALALLVLDLDDFYQLNSALGFDIGDRLLQTVADELQRLADLTVARVGADEFAVVVEVAAGAAVERTEEIAEDLRHRLTRPIHVGGLAVSVEASVGAAIGPLPSGSPITLLSVAESNLRVAKSSLARIATSDVRDSGSYDEALAVVAELRLAIENDDLCLFYQPKIDLTTGAVTGVEALVRWDHRRRGLLPPAAFIPLAERTGLIRPLTQFVLREAIVQLARWQFQELDMSISVNLGAANLDDAGLPSYISQLLDDYGVEPRKLILEITESAVMAESERTTSVVRQLNSIGVQLSIDDFGTAHSSLARLRTLPIREIKLDKTFVTNMEETWHDVTIVRSSINLGHDLGLRVVAEGVETDEVADHLRRLGCDVGQGYWLAKPMAATAATAWLEVASGGALPGRDAGNGRDQVHGAAGGAVRRAPGAGRGR